MSASDPNSAIYVTDSAKVIKSKDVMLTGEVKGPPWLVFLSEIVERHSEQLLEPVVAGYAFMAARPLPNYVFLLIAKQCWFSSSFSRMHPPLLLHFSRQGCSVGERRSKNSRPDNIQGDDVQTTGYEFVGQAIVLGYGIFDCVRSKVCRSYLRAIWAIVIWKAKRTDQKSGEGLILLSSDSPQQQARKEEEVEGTRMGILKYIC
ncbi:hypothetical protein NC652_024207 [Populus alba x Populus x berolinensis]|nr:hypothetical protein NC652_024207 [Populus alba x Populus x berolinensis]